MWDSAKVALRGGRPAQKACVTEEGNCVDELSPLQNQAEKELIKPHLSRGEDRINARGEINEIENRKTVTENQ